MTEKRFEKTTYKLCREAIMWDEKKQLWLGLNSLERELNNQYELIQRLKQDNKELMSILEENKLLEKRISIYKKDGLDTINDFIRLKKQADEFYQKVTETLQKHYDAPYGHRDEKRMLKQIADEIGVDLE